MGKNEQKPAIRFQGFTDPWEQRKLGDVLSFLKDGTHGTHEDAEDGPLLLSAKNIKDGSVKWDETDRRISRAEYEKIHATFSLKRGDVLLTIVGSIGETAILQDSQGVTFQRSVAFLRPGTDISSKFLYAEIQTPMFQKELENRKSTSAQPGIYLGDLAEIPIQFPSKKDEQLLIGNYLGSLDNLITLHQRKYDKLVNVKKSMLEKMFPHDGAKIPEIRFAGFTDPWEQRKVGEVIEDYVEKTTVQNQYPVLTSSQQQGIVLQEDYFADRQVTTNDNVGYYVLPRGYFTYRSRSDTDLFVFNRNNLIDKGIISYYYPVFRPKNADSNFLLRRLNHGIRSQLSMAAEGTGQHVLAHSKFKNMDFLVPSVPEQKLIGAYFEKLDNLITLHQRKLEKLKNIKKSMLEKMFV